MEHENSWKFETSELEIEDNSDESYGSEDGVAEEMSDGEDQDEPLDSTLKWVIFAWDISVSILFSSI